jgi:hypothetical protein
MIARSSAEALIRDSLADVGADRETAANGAARLVDEIYGVPGADSINPRYGFRHYAEYVAD